MSNSRSRTDEGSGGAISVRGMLDEAIRQIALLVHSGNIDPARVGMAIAVSRILVDRTVKVALDERVGRAARMKQWADFEAMIDKAFNGLDRLCAQRDTDRMTYVDQIRVAQSMLARIRNELPGQDKWSVSVPTDTLHPRDMTDTPTASLSAPARSAAPSTESEWIRVPTAAR